MHPQVPLERFSAILAQYKLKSRKYDFFEKKSDLNQKKYDLNKKIRHFFIFFKS